MPAKPRQARGPKPPKPPKATPERPITSLNADEAEKMVDAFHGASPSSEDDLRRAIDSTVYAKPYQQSDAYLRTLAEDLCEAIRPLLQKQADALAKAQAEVERLNEQSASDKTYWDKTNQHLIDDNVAKDRRIAELEQSFQAQRDNYIRLYQAVMGDGTVTAEFADPAEYARALRTRLLAAETAAREGAGERERLALGDDTTWPIETLLKALIVAEDYLRQTGRDFDGWESVQTAAEVAKARLAALSAQPPAKSEGET